MSLRSLMRRVAEATRLRRKAFLTNHIRIHYAQFGEDIALREIFGKRRTGFYVDVGCYHPRKFSNTYALHRRGWHGINIDMEDNKVQLFRLARPRDWNVVAAVSDEPRRVRVQRPRDFDLSATIEDAVSRGFPPGREDVGEPAELVTRTLEDIVATSPFHSERIDLLSIDAEGHDFRVLRSLDIDARRPEVIVIEEHSRDIEAILAGDIYAHLAPRGYRLWCWHAPSLVFRHPATPA